MSPAARKGAGTPRGRRQGDGGSAPRLGQIGVRLPRATLRMLDAEAACFNWSRGELLDALMWQEIDGRVKLTRPREAPKRYKFTKEDWTTPERWIWYLTTDGEQRVRDHLLRLGNLRPAAWIVLAVNKWVGDARGAPT
jgi:hypothetical protein